MRLLKYAALMCCALLLGCSSDDSDKSAGENLGLPYIAAIYPRIDHYHPSYWANRDLPASPEREHPTETEAPNEIGLSFGVDFQVRHPDGMSEFTEIYVENHGLNETYTWHVLAGPNSVDLAEFYDEGLKEFRTTFYYDTRAETDDISTETEAPSSERIPLEGYAVTLVDRKGNLATKRFDFSGFNARSLDGKEYVYSALYCPPPYTDDTECNPPTFRGMRAMEAMTVEENDLSFESDTESQTFTIGFTHRDSRARDYKIEFYGPLPERAYIGMVDFQGDLIVETPLVSRQPTILNLLYSEVDLEEGMQIESIDGIHIVLADELVTYEYLKENPEDSPVFKWAFKYSGYSEFVPLSAPSNE